MAAMRSVTSLLSNDLRRDATISLGDSNWSLSLTGFFFLFDHENCIPELEVALEIAGEATAADIFSNLVTDAHCHTG